MNKSELEKALAHAERWPIDRSVLAAARRFADLKGEECETCWGSGHEQLRKDDNGDLWVLSPCRTCHGLGKVWNPEVVERVATAIHGWRWSDLSESNKNLVRDQARAVLAALTEEEKP